MEMKRIKLTRSIILNREHAEEGEVHDVERALAYRLIGEGSAVHHVEEGGEPEAGPTSVNRMESPTSADPVSRRVSGKAPKVKE
jgi:hypothetical protein